MFAQLTIAILVALSIASEVVPHPTVINSNHVRIPFVRRHNLTGTSVVKSDQARAQFLKTRHLREKTGSSPDNMSRAKSAAAAIGVDVTNGAVTYTADVRDVWLAGG